MPGIEYGYCSMAEYEAGRQSRIREEAFEEREFYTAMFALEAIVARPRAAKFASRVNQVQQLESGLYKVNLTLLNVRPPYEEETDSRFQDGYWQQEGSDNITFSNRPFMEGYLKPFDLDADGALQEWTVRDIERQLEAPPLSPSLAA